MKSKTLCILLCIVLMMNFFGAVVRNNKESDSTNKMLEDPIMPSEEAEYEYKNEDSKFNVHFDESTMGDGVKVSVGENWVVWNWKEMSFKDDTNTIETIYSVNDVEGLKKGNTVTFEGTYPFTSEMFTISENRLKHDIILDQLPNSNYNFGKIKYLNFIGTLDLSDELLMYVDGIEQKGDFITASNIGFVDGNGIEQFFIPSPYSYEKDNEKERIDCHYEVKYTNGKIMFYISTPYEWLSDVARNYPLVIDPTFLALYEPVADAGPDQIGYVDNTISFDGSASHDVDGDIVSYDWDFGDGSPHGSGETTSHVYNPNAIYTVTLTVTDNDGLTGTDTTIMYISNSIQDLIDAASPGDTVNVPADLYWERIIIDKPLTLIGQDKNTTIIDGWGLYGDEGPTVTIIASNVKIQDFTIINGSYGVYAPGTGYNYLTISYNIIKSNKYYGIRLRESSNNVISNNIIKLNMQSPWSGNGILISSDYGHISHDNIIVNNIIDSNGDYGIFIYSYAIDLQAISTYNTISGNTITNHSSQGIRLYKASNNLIMNNNISESYRGIYLSGSNNTIDINDIWDCSYGIRLGDSGSHSNDNLISNNSFTNNYYGIIFYDDDRLAINNIIRFNTFAYNDYGVTIDYPGKYCGDLISRTKIYLNNFVYNTMHGYDGGYDNRWDTGNIGNYWTDYLGIDCGGMSYPWDTNSKHLIANDGIGDTLVPHMVDEDSGDYYPIIRLSGWIPTADAGPDQTVSIGETVFFSGIGSWDLDGWIVNYTWDFGGGNFGYGMNTTSIYMSEGVYNVTLIVTDNDGFRGMDYCIITVLSLNEPPEADANGPYSGGEGSSIIFNASGSFDLDGDILQYRWDLNGDGIWDTNWSFNPLASYTWGDDYSGTVSVEVYDGEFTDTATANVTIFNVAPSVDAGVNQTVDEGDLVYFNGSFIDPGWLDSHTIVWDFGDGNIESGTLKVTHLYGDNGLYTVTLTVTDDDGGVTTQATYITVNNVAPQFDFITAPGGDEGTVITYLSTAIDSGSDDLTFTWNWGDGTSNTIIIIYNDGMGPDPYPSPWGTCPFTATTSANHVFGDNGVYSISLTLEDDDGGITTYTTNITVNNVAPSIDSILAPGGDEGSSIAYQATGSDSGSDDLTFTWSWGDGTSDTQTIYYNDGVGPDPYPSPWGTYPFSVTNTPSHTYGDNGIYTITLTVEDDDGLVTTFTTNVTIDNVAPTINSVSTPGGDEGSVLAYLTTATDQGTDDLTFTWDWGDRTSDTTTIYYNDGSSPDPYPSPWGTYPFSVTDSVQHTYGDNGVFTITLTVEDDDGGMTSYSANITINNVAPTIDSVTAPSGDEGTVLSYLSSATDQGSDDMTFTWSWGDGTSDTQTIYYNDGTGPDPFPSPWGTFPFSVGDTIQHIYGDNGIYIITLAVEDDDGGSITYTTNVTIDNVAPTITPFEPFSVDEGSLLDILAISTDPGSDDLTFTWEFELGPTITNVYYNDGVDPDPYPSPWGTFPYSVTDIVEHIYGDNGNYSITLSVEDDDGGFSVYTTYVMVYNVAPTIENVEAYMLVNFTLRAAGEKWHNVEMYIMAGSSEIAFAEVVRHPGNPDEQSVTLYDVKCDVTRAMEIKIVYTPLDDPINGQINGATPVWVTMDFDDGEDVRLHHTCNVKHPDTWEWIIGVNQYFTGHNITFEADASDPGSDDLTFSWDWGDGSPLAETLCCNDGVNPEPFYEPAINDIRNPWGICPFSAADMKKHLYMTGGNYSVTLTVTDDDGGAALVVITVILT